MSMLRNLLGGGGSGSQTPAQKAGFSEGDYAEVVETTGFFKEGSILQLTKDDGSDTPWWLLIQGEMTPSHNYDSEAIKPHPVFLGRLKPTKGGSNKPQSPARLARVFIDGDKDRDFTTGWHGVIRFHPTELDVYCKDKGRDITVVYPWAIKEWEDENGNRYPGTPRDYHSHGSRAGNSAGASNGGAHSSGAGAGSRTGGVDVGTCAKPSPAEPDWSEPDDAERTWARSTMPGAASGHDVAYRSWEVTRNPNADFPIPDQESLLQQDASALWQTMMDLYNSVLEAQEKPSWLLSSKTADFVWPAGEPVIATDNPKARGNGKGPGVYGYKTPEQLQHHFNSDDPVFGEFAVWGDVIYHEKGVRARYAYPTRLYVKKSEPNAHDLAQALSLAYPQAEVSVGLPPEYGLEADASGWTMDTQHMSYNQRQAMVDALHLGQVMPMSASAMPSHSHGSLLGTPPFYVTRNDAMQKVEVFQGNTKIASIPNRGVDYSDLAGVYFRLRTHGVDGQSAKSVIDQIRSLLP